MQTDVYDLTNLSALTLHATAAEVATFAGQQGLRLEGLALIPDLTVGDARLEVQIAAEGPAYPGLVFRAADTRNYELAYPQPHTSGQWDAMQYDPVFDGSNTWQLYTGPAYQTGARVPTGEWFTLRAVLRGGRATIRVNRERPLTVVRLAHRRAAGLIGVWTYKPAYFRDLRITPAPALPVAGVLPLAPRGTIETWDMDGTGMVATERGGTLNLNRYLPVSAGSARLAQRFETVAPGPVEFAFGFSDKLTLSVDGEVIYTGTNTFTGFADRAARGYVEPGAYVVTRDLPQGDHVLQADLEVTEGFGWGIHMALRGRQVRQSPVA